MGQRRGRAESGGGGEEMSMTQAEIEAVLTRMGQEARKGAGWYSGVKNPIQTICIELALGLPPLAVGMGLAAAILCGLLRLAQVIG